ncbi:porin family protein [Grimontia marina]|uniref:Outer membrane protein beta-barrel domain-containing protein n=1 Tax=Grimontia marina TaxID=646534 RepID=A0A128FLB3_9GAMM|nr:porin family protein [Grimontia marina]CZF87006.1 hypothetical protein GMA8713_05047 [Grimontia marina]
MKKAVLVGSIFLLPLSALAADFSGHRAGVGFISADIENVYGERVDWGNGFKLEYGYDISRIFGVNMSYSNTSDSVELIADGKRYGTNLKTNTYKLDADIGYTFDLNQFYVKPYGVIGLASYKDKYEFHAGDAGSTSSSYSDTAIYVGAGVRATFNDTIYTDLRIDRLTDDAFTDHFSLSIGYKF